MKQDYVTDCAECGAPCPAVFKIPLCHDCAVKKTRKDFLKFVVLPVVLALFLYWFATMIFQTSEHRVAYTLLFMGVPYGIRRMFLWVIPVGYGLAGTIGILAVNIIVGAVIGVVVLVYQLIKAVVYIVKTIIAAVKIAGYKKIEILQA